MITISLCMIVKNEEETIGRCLDSVHDLVDEINIVDTGSTDRTKEIVSQYTNRIFDFEWIQDFAAARNYSFDQATQDYIFWLDADDVLLEKDRERFRELKGSLDTRIDSVIMNYVLSRDSGGNAHNVTRHNRLVKRSISPRWIYPIHEILVIRGSLLLSPVEITHAPKLEKRNRTRNLTILQEHIRKDGPSRRSEFYLANELFDNERYDEALAAYESFLQGSVENFEDHIAACGVLAHLYHERGDLDRELQYLFKTFEYDVPRADYVCRIGLWFEQKGEYRLASYWYEEAAEQDIPVDYFGLMNLVCWTWVPHVQLMLCYGKLGELGKALEHIEKALSYFPNDPNLLENKKRLEAAMEQQRQHSEEAAVDRP
ncbi:glycosyltransferase [Cohnella lubricantis]|uniref:Glycosyltransferase n=1 Tax=Cohnella lubricantis TaxID=2163172 RepID=A0A841TFE3_9BACL|nr:glycosyltransferase [Cohnella lubricantis]MBB6677191.1 glycosyltransferase [Cohnella lubricantis]MBP2116998.1 glycosyltransferase involved in cell wall biosynthesis [Cohnella lubricantis]